MKEKEDKEIIFKGRVIRQTYDGGDYKIYALDVDKEIYPEIKFTKYGNATITGEMHELGIGIEYEIKAIEQNTKYGYSYKVLNIRRDKPKSASDMYIFLEEILTLKQANTLYEIYPDIVDRVMNDHLDDIDLNKLPGIKEYTFNIIKEKIITERGIYCFFVLDRWPDYCAYWKLYVFSNKRSSFCDDAKHVYRVGF